ncbi:MAG: glycoside hydrolase family 9 protein [Spirochaetaceae bacterium]
MRILTNHLGYDAEGPKRALLEASSDEQRSLFRLGPEDSSSGAGSAGSGAGSAAAAAGGTVDTGVPGGPTFEVLRDPDGTVLFSGACRYVGAVPGWSCGEFYELAFDDLREEGLYHILVRPTLGEPAVEPLAVSAPFEVGPALLFRETFADVLWYFKGQRCGGDEDQHDRAASFFGDRQDRVDVHGGWYDASGDTSKYLSHLSYANFLNPQQTPAVVWAMLAARDALAGSSLGSGGLGGAGGPSGPGAAGAGEVLPEEAAGVSAGSERRGPALWDRRLREEAAWGADFLVRMQDPAGYFYMTVFDRWSKDLDERIISSFRTQKGRRGTDYQAGLRQGGGMAIAALARAAGSGLRGEFDSQRYLSAARSGFAHLREHNGAYLDDGEENIIDDYCGLLAAGELFAATGEPAYRAAAQDRVARLRSRFGAGETTASNGTAAGCPHWYADRPGGRPYYHAAEAGLPVMALLRFGEILGPDTEDHAVTTELAARALAAELEVTAFGTNPFGYARQYVPAGRGSDRSDDPSRAAAGAADGPRTPKDGVRPGAGPRSEVGDTGRRPEGERVSFFIPHVNETGYWWQGENARIASLASAALWAAKRMAPGGQGAEAEAAGAAGAPGASGATAGCGGAPPPEALRRYATDQLNWILGLNPFDMCMLDGAGRNNPEYMAAFPNAPGGICNGITAGFDDEDDVAFLPEPVGSSELHRWRWSEQWIPHAGWYLLAVSLAASLYPGGSEVLR